MADTKHGLPGSTHSLPVEGDGINYRGIVWFVVILAITTACCQVLMWGLFRVLDNRAAQADAAAPPPPLARPALTEPPPPNLLFNLDEPGNLQKYRESEELRLTTYGWVDRNAGRVRIPIERAKTLLLERGLPVRGNQQDQQP